MADCDKCGEKDMTFSCRYCNGEFCTDHRLPENHSCEMDQESSDEWFEDRSEASSPKDNDRPKPSAVQRFKRFLRLYFPDGISPTLGIIGFTSAVFLLQLLTGFGNNSFWQNFVLTSDLAELSGQPWAFFTASFLHNGVLHWFANMVTLYFFGTALERVLSVREYLVFYFLSGAISMAGFVIFQNLLSVMAGASLGSAVGASGSVVAVFAAVAVIHPDAEMLLYFFVPMKLKTGLKAFGFFEAFNMLLKLNGVFVPVLAQLASSAHLSALIVGVFLGKKMGRRARNGLLRPNRF